MLNIKEFSVQYKPKIEEYIKGLRITQDLKQKALDELHETRSIRFENLNYMEYTYRHRLAIELLYDILEDNIIKIAHKAYYDETSFVEKMTEQIKKHDSDKLFMYMFLTKKTSSQIHRQTTTHHENSIPKTLFDHIEAILDWESAYLTKDDKPLNAYDTLIQAPSYADYTKIWVLLTQLGMASSYNVREQYPKIFDSLRYITFSLKGFINNIPTRT